MAKTKLSVALATFNEEKNLGSCLASVKDWVDEIVVVDGRSADKTVTVAKKYGARVIVTDNPPIFHINKQKAIDACQGKWILQLDADERVSPELKKEILQVINSQTKLNGFWLPRRNFFLGRYLKKGGQYPDYTLRLYRRGKGRLPCQSVHEQAEVKGKVGYLKNDLLHHADPSFKRYLLRFNRYTDLLATELAEKRLGINLFSAANYCLLKPLWWFFRTYFRHKGFIDGWQGFIFSFFSSLRFVIAYFKYWQKGK
jgi:glycosyltransferase involved in cell wall biosynthesis